MQCIAQSDSQFPLFSPPSKKIVNSSDPDGTYQDVQAIRAQEADKYGANGSDEQPRVVEGIGHSQNPGSQTAFEQVDERLGISTNDDR